MWLPDPRSSPGPHLDGQRWLSVGTVQVWACAGTHVRAVVAARTIPTTLCRIVVFLPRWIELRAESIAALGRSAIKAWRPAWPLPHACRGAARPRPAP